MVWVTAEFRISPGLCLMLSLEPHFDVTLLRSTFLLSICTCQKSYRHFIEERSKHCTLIRIPRFLYTLKYSHQDRQCSPKDQEPNQVVEHKMTFIVLLLCSYKKRKKPSKDSECKFKIMLLPLPCDVAEL